MKEQALDNKNSNAVSTAGIARGFLQRKCDCGTHTVGGSTCDKCSQKQQTLRRAASTSEHKTQNSFEVPPVVHEVLRSPGLPLDANTRSFMEPRFGHDFSRVRVHTDARASESARAVNALAYTVGRNVVFEAGHYAPDTGEGRRLLAHELTHVMQQNGTARMQPSTLEVGEPSDAYEREADAVAARALDGRGVDAAHVSRLSLQRMQRTPRQDTHAGLFELARHAPLGGPTFTPRMQYDVRIEFLPYDIVDCDQIAMTQKWVSRTSGAVSHSSAADAARSLTAAEGTEGASIDRLSGRTSPLYGVDNAGTTASNAHFGSHTPGNRAERAWMTDAPGFTGATPAASRGAGVTDSSHFETCAICAKGTDLNAYYGCVSWGYDIDALDKFTEDTFERVSKGTPSSEFLAAARKWNDQTVPAATDDLPIPSHATRNEHMKLSELDAEIKSLETKLKGLAAGHADIPQVTFELRVLRDIREAIRYNEEDQRYLKIETEMIQEKVGAIKDGTWGYDTVRRVKIWQARNGLVADGRVGPDTLSKMKIYRVGDYPSPNTSPMATRIA
jgi:hypothetical protein